MIRSRPTGRGTATSGLHGSSVASSDAHQSSQCWSKSSGLPGVSSSSCRKSQLNGSCNFSTAERRVCRSKANVAAAASSKCCRKTSSVVTHCVQEIGYVRMQSRNAVSTSVAWLRSKSASTKATMRSRCSLGISLGWMGCKLAPWVTWGGSAPSWACVWSWACVGPMPGLTGNKCPLAHRSLLHRPTFRRWSCILVVVWNSFLQHGHHVSPNKHLIGLTCPCFLKICAPSPPFERQRSPHLMQP